MNGEYSRFDKTRGSESFDFWGDGSESATPQNALESLATSLEKKASATFNPFEKQRLQARAAAARERAARGFTSMPDRS